MKLRQAISAVVFKKNKFLMISGKGWPKNSWAFPQGGINEDEKPIQAVIRELLEEFGTDQFRIIQKCSIEHTYYFPEEIKKKKGFDGQKQTIWFVEFIGDESELMLNTKELSQMSWFNEAEVVPNMKFTEQKETFAKVLDELRILRIKKPF